MSEGAHRFTRSLSYVELQSVRSSLGQTPSSIWRYHRRNICLATVMGALAMSCIFTIGYLSAKSNNQNISHAIGQGLWNLTSVLTKSTKEPINNSRAIEQGLAKLTSIFAKSIEESKKSANGMMIEQHQAALNVSSSIEQGMRNIVNTLVNGMKEAAEMMANQHHRQWKCGHLWKMGDNDGNQPELWLTPEIEAQNETYVKAYYLQDDNTTTAKTTKTICENMKMRMVTIESDTESDYLAHFLTSTLPGKEMFWTSATDGQNHYSGEGGIFHAPNWVWSTTGEEVDLNNTNWETGRPINHTGHFLRKNACMVVKNDRRWFPKYFWFDIPCREQAWAICEMTLPSECF